jgi:hypothetical protein
MKSKQETLQPPPPPPPRRAARMQSIVNRWKKTLRCDVTRVRREIRTPIIAGPEWTDGQTALFASTRPMVAMGRGTRRTPSGHALIGTKSIER